MFKEYTTVSGDTFSSISRALTGSERNASLIKQQNPHATSPLTPGTRLFIKTGDSAKKKYNSDGLDVRIDGTPLGVYDSFTCTRAIDGFGRAEFVVPNEISTRAILPLLTPLSVDIGYNGQAMFAGYIKTPRPQNDDSKKWLSIDAASWPNLLMGPAPISAFPMEFIKSDLEIIAGTLIAPYGIEWFFYSDFGPVFSKLKIKQDDNVLEFLSGLCKQRGLIIRDDQFGSVVFDTGEISGEPVLAIDGPNRPDVQVGPVIVNPSDYYSHITGVLKSKNKRKRKKKTIENPFYRGIMRQHEFEISDSDEGELETAVNTVAARMFASVFQLPITVPGWTDKNGDIIAPGGSVSVRSPKDYIEDYTELLIAGVTLNGSENYKSSTLTCVLPGVYAGRIPEVVPWTSAR